MNIVVLGSGTFGTAIANELSFNKKNKVVLFTSNTIKALEINTKHTNKVSFPNKVLNVCLEATNDEGIFANADVVFIALPSNIIVSVISNLKSCFNKKILFVNLSKGILVNSTTIVEGIKNTLGTQEVVSLKGPSFAAELIERSKTLLTLGYESKIHLDIINRIVNKTVIYLDYTNDIRGVEIMSVIKNVYAIFIGIVDAKYNSANTRFMILTKTFSEIQIIARALRCNESTLFLACGLGDFCLTSLNDLSRNRTLGLLIGKGFFSFESKSNNVITEGMHGIKLLSAMLEKNVKLQLPIFNKLYDFVVKNESIIDIDFDEIVSFNTNQ